MGEIKWQKKKAAAVQADADTDASLALSPLELELLAEAHSAEGVKHDDLTAAQVRALTSLLLQNAGALDEAGKVKALEVWLVRRPRGGDDDGKDRKAGKSTGL